MGDSTGAWSYWSVSTPLILFETNSSPTASNVTATEPDYCTSGPAVTVSWTFADPGDPTPQQSAYQVQIDDDPAFGSVNFDSGKVMSSSTAYLQSGLGWNVQYYSRARVWDEGDVSSAWTNQLFCVGPGCIGGTAWRSPAHPYPTNVNNFSWTPIKPPIGSPVTFNDGPTTCYSAPGVPTPCSTWAWTFGDPLGGISTLQSPVYTYTTAGSYNVNVTVTDGTSYSCTPSVPKVITVQAGLPFIKEVLPK
jgi:PKD repeat protein